MTQICVPVLVLLYHEFMMRHSVYMLTNVCVCAIINSSAKEVAIRQIFKMKTHHYYRNDNHQQSLLSQLIKEKVGKPTKEVYLDGEFLPFDFVTHKDTSAVLNDSFTYLGSTNGVLTRVNGVMSDELIDFISTNHVAWQPSDNEIDKYLMGVMSKC